MTTPTPAPGDGSPGTSGTPGPAGDATRRRVPTGLVAALVLTALLGLYVWLIGTRALTFLRTGEPVGVAIGVAVAVIPLLVLGLVAREWALAVDVQKMADTLAARGELPVDDLPRSPGGRIDRETARAQFDAARAEAERAEPGDWGTWYRLAFAYDAAGDRRAARAALRTASRIHRTR